jgi:hypothetical protein
MKPYASLAPEISSRQRCACTWRGPTALFTSYRSVSAIYPIGYDPLPYRFGYFPEPYRYRHRVTMLTARPYRYYWRYPQGKPAGVNRQA